jgi:uncharacterized protein
VTLEQGIGLGLALLVMGAGTIGSMVPAVPGTPLVLAAAIVHRLVFGAHSANTTVLLIMGALALVSFGLDYLATFLGAKKLGATWRGMVGAILGTLVGFFFSLPGLILGPFLGAALFELMGGRKWKEAARAGAGAVLGLLLGAIGKCACCVAMMALFTVSVILRSGASP